MSSENRQRLIRLIHVAKRELQLDDDMYRDLIRSKFNSCESASALTVPQLELFVSHLKKIGFKVRHKKGGRAQATDAQATKIRALWLDLAAHGVVRDSSEEALAAFVKRETKVDALQWLKADQASAVIERLKKWGERENVL